jgi:hypothetical protein
MMLVSWPCKVSSEIHINGRRVSEPVRDDKGKTIAPEPEDKKGMKRACVVLSKGHEVVGPGYSRVTGVAAKVMDKKENSGNHGQVNRVSKTEQHYPSQVSQVTWVRTSSSTDQRTYEASRVNRVSRVGSMEQKTGGSSRVANTEVQVIENSANTKSWITENSANTESRATENSSNTESRFMENSVNMERPAPQWCPRGITKTQK